MSTRKFRSQSGKSEPTKRAEKPEGNAPKKEEKGAAEPESLEQRLEAAERRAEENRDRLLRVMAEFENYKKRMEREMEDYRKFANESLMKEILPILDNLERALETPNEENEKATGGIREGIEMTLKGLLSSLEKFGVVPIESLDKPFDPNFHEAVMQKESGGHSESTVVQELQKGYLIGDRLLRPARVVVSKKPDAKAKVESGDSEDPYKVDVTIQ